MAFNVRVNICVLLLCLSNAQAGIERNDGTNWIDEDNVVWRSERVCALNSLYFLIRLSGHDADYFDMQRYLLKPELASLEDIRIMADRLGVKIRVARMTPQDLKSIETPVIAHTDAVDVSGISRGHFIVVFDTDSAGVHYVDGTTAEVRHIPWRKFERVWSGYSAHIVNDHGVGSQRLFAPLSFVGGVLCGLALLYCHQRHHKPRLDFKS